MPWAAIGASVTTWVAPAAASDATWASNATSRLTYGWLPLSIITDLWHGIDFVPAAYDLGNNPAPYKASTDRPVVTWELSVITGAAFAAEARP